MSPRSSRSKPGCTSTRRTLSVFRGRDGRVRGDDVNMTILVSSNTWPRVLSAAAVASLLSPPSDCGPHHGSLLNNKNIIVDVRRVCHTATSQAALRAISIVFSCSPRWPSLDKLDRGERYRTVVIIIYVVFFFSFNRFSSTK